MPSIHILIIPGSWHRPLHCAPLIHSLSARGLPATTIPLPTTSLTTTPIKSLAHPDFTGPPPQPPWPDMHADAAAVKATLQELVDSGKEVIVATHSYGGMPLAEALTPELCAGGQGKGKVVGVFAMSTLLPPVGMSTEDTLGGRMDALPEQPSGLFTCTDPESLLFNDMPPEEAAHWIGLLVAQPWSVHQTRVTNSGFLNVRCAYLKTLRDRGFTLDNQVKVIEGARQMGATIDEYEVDSGHEPLLSQPDACADAIADFRRRVASGGEKTL